MHVVRGSPSLFSSHGRGIGPEDVLKKALQCSCLENPRDQGAWWAALDWVPGAAPEKLECPDVPDEKEAAG